MGEERAVDERGPREPGETAPLPQALSQGIEGTGIPLRVEELGVADKQPHGSAETREVKLVTIWSAELFVEQVIPRRDEGSINYSADLESGTTRNTAVERCPFAQRVWCEASRRRFCQAPRTAVLGDGAARIWNIASDHFPEAVQVVDRFHAQKHWSDLGKSLYSPTDSRPAPWAKRRREELDAGQFRKLLTAIRRHVARSEEARCYPRYFRTHRERICYPEFHAQGLCTSTRTHLINSSGG